VLIFRQQFFCEGENGLMTQTISKTISKKASAAKLKAHLALAGFVAVAVIALTLTMVGLFGYATLDLNVQPDGVQSQALAAPASMTTQTASLGTIQGN
jgi:hypothetical protein